MARLFIADDHPIYLSGMAQFMSDNGHEVVCSANSVADCGRMLKSHIVDILILDVSMGDGSSVDLLMELRATRNEIPIILLTAAIDPPTALLAIKSRVNAIVLKDSAPEEIIKVIDLVLCGETYIDEHVSDQVKSYSEMRPQNENFPDKRLTQRENEIVELVRRGLRNHEIGQRCDLTEGTVKVHLHNIFRKLDVKSRYEIVVRHGNADRQSLSSSSSG